MIESTRERLSARSNRFYVRCGYTRNRCETTFNLPNETRARICAGISCCTLQVNRQKAGSLTHALYFHDRLWRTSMRTLSCSPDTIPYPHFLSLLRLRVRLLVAVLLSPLHCVNFILSAVECCIVSKLVPVWIQIGDHLALNLHSNVYFRQALDHRSSHCTRCLMSY